MKRSSRLEVGSKVQFDGKVHSVVEFDGRTVVLRSQRLKKRRVLLTELIGAAEFKVFTPLLPDVPDAKDDLPYELSAEQEGTALTLLCHLRGATTGYKSGAKETALPGELRDAYHPNLTTLTQRIRTKAEELGLGERTLHRHKAKFEEQGLAGLVNRRTLRIVQPTGRADERLITTIDETLNEHVNATNITKGKFRRLVKKKLESKYGESTVHMPSVPTFNKLLDKRGRGQGIFGAAKTRRGLASRPPTPYRRIAATRSGEYVMLDVTDLDAFGMDPLSLEWVPLKLALALDVYSHSVLARRFIHRDKQVDAALLL